MKNAPQPLNLPAGFRFHPTDDELVLHYLCRKCAGHHISAPIAAELDLYKFDPWDLPALALYGEKEWYFFSPRDRKYPNGSRPNRTAGTGYWKATGADKPVGKPKTLGIKKSLVFYAGKSPTGVKTDWIMHEYRLANVDRSAANKDKMRLDDWVLCRIYNKKGTVEKHYNGDPNELQLSDSEEQKPTFDADPYIKMAASPPPLASQMMNDNSMNFDLSHLLPKVQADLSSSGSGRVLLSWDKDVQNEPNWNGTENTVNFELGEAFQDDLFMPQMQYNDQFSLFQGTFVRTQQPF